MTTTSSGNGYAKTNPRADGGCGLWIRSGGAPKIGVIDAPGHLTYESMMHFLLERK